MGVANLASRKAIEAFDQVRVNLSDKVGLRLAAAERAPLQVSHDSPPCRAVSG
jgi:hypothetical protein